MNAQGCIAFGAEQENTKDSCAAGGDIEIKDGQVCVNIDNNLDESESDIFQSAPTQDDNNRDGDITIRDFNNENNNCNDRSTTYINQGEGDNKIGDVNFD